MTFRDAVITCFRKYFTFSGRASRPEYWWFFLFTFLGSIAAQFVEAVINIGTSTPGGPTILSAVFSIVTFFPGLSAGWRRMHDTGRSGLYLLYPLIAMIGLGTFVALFGGADPTAGGFSGFFGVIILMSLVVIALSPLLVLWWLTRPSQPGQNQYGPNPHEVYP